MIESAPAPLSLYDEYLPAVRDALQQQPHQWSFKRDPRYRTVLEHVTADQGEAFWQWSLAAMPDLDINLVRVLCERNDSVGRPVQEAIPGLGTYSPSNMRYLCHAIKVWQHVDSLKLRAVNIVEIGGGYGGLALYLFGLSNLFNTLVVGYRIADLRDVALLQRLVLAKLGVPAYTRDGANPYVDWGSHGPLFGISAYAFSEFDQPTRDWYAERVLKYCRHGLMVWNFPERTLGSDRRVFGGPPYQFVEWPITREPDKPDLYPGHELVRW